MNVFFKSKNEISEYKFLVNSFVFIVVFSMVYFSHSILAVKNKEFLQNVFTQEVKDGAKSKVNNDVKWDLSTTFGREMASIEKPVSPYTVKKCGEVRHTDGEIMTICIVNFNGTSGGFYDADKELMVVGSFNEYTLLHEIFHATSIHYFKKGYTDMLGKEAQEKMAYNAENLLMQIRAFQEDLNITPDLSNEKKGKLGINLATVYSENLIKNVNKKTEAKGVKVAINRK